jgi:hypothetical protein
MQKTCPAIAAPALRHREDSTNCTLRVGGAKQVTGNATRLGRAPAIAPAIYSVVY